MYSFDVFDTLMMRTTATPWGIFALMKDRLKKEQKENGLDDYVIDNFYELRIHGEELIREANIWQECEETTIADIYRAMAICGCISAEQADYLRQLEQELEMANVMGIPENIKRLKALRAKGERVVLISDMYLPKEIIHNMLLQVDPIFEDIPLYVSSEYGKRKTTGNLYRQVQMLEQADYENWIHIGDNMHQDINVPFQLGIQAELAAKIELTPFEANILENYGDDSRLQLVIGTALAAERMHGIGAEQESIVSAYHIGCRYAGPVLYSYAEWIVDQAVKKGIKRLYFIARDGYLIKQIVDVILSGSRIDDIRTSYLYGSRKAWRMPSLSEEHYNLYQLILWSHVCRINTLEELASVLHLTLPGLYLYLPGIYSKNKEDIHITERELEYIAERLSENEEFKQYHLQQMKKEKEIIQQYLMQEIDTSDDQFAFVDVSGGGLTQGCLHELMKAHYPKPIRTFFFKIDRVNLAEGSITDTFMPSFLENNLTIEMMCRAPHGQTKGYAVENGRVVPELEETESRRLIEYGFDEYEKGILDFSKRMCKVSEINKKKVSLLRIVLLYLHHIAKEPSEDVLEYFASMPSSESGRGEELIEYAPRLTEHEIKEIFLRRTTEPLEYFYKGTDLNYSVMRATRKEKRLIGQCKREYTAAFGRLYRQEDERRKKELRRIYGKAALYPTRLLDERLVLYGAGKLGQDLYQKLSKDGGHEVVLWVDKEASACRQRGLSQVQDVSKLHQTVDEQIVIAVLSEDVADTIQNELEQMGIAKKRITWIPLITYPNPNARWKAKGIG